MCKLEDLVHTYSTHRDSPDPGVEATLALEVGMRTETEESQFSGARQFSQSVSNRRRHQHGLTHLSNTVEILDL